MSHGGVRAQHIEAVYRELWSVTRSAGATARRETVHVTPAQHAVMYFVAEHPGCRATDFASELGLNRSTASRHIGALVGAGLLRYAAPPAASRRGRALELTEEGAGVRERVLLAHREVVRQRLEGWSDEDIARFVAQLSRFNSGPGRRETSRRGNAEAPTGPACPSE